MEQTAVVGKTYDQAAEPESSLTVSEEEIKYLTEDNKRKKLRNSVEAWKRQQKI